MQVDVISASLTDILDDLKLGWNRCKVCHQHKYFDQGGLSREREFGPGAFCPRRKCGAERDLKARNLAHMFSRNGSFAFSAKEALVDNCSSSELTWCYWPLPGCHGISSSLQISVDVTLKISREYRREYPSLRPTCSAVARTCCRAGGVLGTTVVDLDRGETGAAC